MRHRFFALFCLLALAASCSGLQGGDQVVEGSYDTETRYDMLSLSGALTGAISPWQAPQDAISEQIWARMGQKAGSGRAATLALSTARRSYGQQVTADILGHVTDTSPPWMLNLSSELDTVDAQLGRVDVATSMLIGQRPDGSYEATEIWNSIAVFRDPSCRDRGGLNCAQISLDTQALLSAEYPVEIVSASYDAALESPSLMTLSGQNVSFNYGRLALYLLTNLVLPDEPGQGLGLRDLVLAGINCRGVAGRLAGSDNILGWNVAGVQLGLDVNELVGACQEGVFAMVNDFVDQFSLPLTMSVGGSLSLMDPDGDGVIDQLATSSLQGTLTTTSLGGEQSSGELTGQLTGWRVGDVPGAGSGAHGDDIDDGTTIWEGGD